MLQPRLRPSLNLFTSPSSSTATLSLLSLALTRLFLHPHHPPIPYTPHRAASHASQGRANKAAPGPGKRLGAKKSDSELVVPGNIIFRQRGTHWFPGENCGMGRDHTIFALQKGFVRFYRDPDRHPDRKFIGVVFEQGMTLPTGRNAVRRRRLGMVEIEREEKVGVERREDGVVLRPGYMVRESNYSIGRTADRAGVKAKLFNSKDRFLAWRKATARNEKIADKRGMRRRR
ncbi:54S ribosomal protein L2 mitochondrial [Lambiella insularis]|nr:54S ribosomal protein L2 mitochondrial [Lambiella insularis]